ncbi:COPII-coated vesicle component Sec31 [Schizosaccharomyces cryophilus OY26]|uniref:Protein transport protein SEC31 n=1 Tax=Schizosaccharomyces cryophilus (strain OY26 / ATCC MYA-4695 / CBS 11777 / NBRC 106824 / NRRL Y48691) TaxID=653667 RepID=S9VSW4_SCHCR|nr:COPII-coated vesicle component Sec31 [Schizosaccharomyces cryophilus OY26]EPY49259.1 COPII-coated vesicle component Sec31 [Schizosaccharomyces cryophilus OY26]
MRLKDINKSATLAWSPRGVNDNQPLLAIGGYIGTENARESDNLLEIWDTSSESNKPIGSTNVNTKFYDLDWEKSLDKQYGVIAGTLEEGGIGFYDASAILDSNENAASIATYKSENNSILGPLDFNPVQTNLLASGDNNGDVWVWDIKNPSKPFSLPKQNRSSEIHVVAWNSKVSHILASSNSSEYTTVWDLKAKRQILNLSYMGATGTSATGGVNSIAWHPENATRLVTAIDDNRNPIILTWDLRYPTTPQNVLTGHQKAALSLSWCPQDPRFLLSSGKDGRAIVWDVDSGESLGNFPRSGNWYTKGSWCPSNSNRVATASLDGKVSIFSIQSTNTDKSHEASLQGVTSIDDNEFFNNLPSIAGSQEPAFSLPVAPKWYKVPCGVRFGFPNKLIHFSPDSKNVVIEPIEIQKDEEPIDNFSSTTKFQTENDIVAFCDSGAKSAKTEEEANNWKLLKAVSQRVSRSEFVKLLGHGNIKEMHKEDSTTEFDENIKASSNANDTSKNLNNESYDDDTSFYGKLSDSLQNTTVSDKNKVEVSNDPFKIFNSEDSELETNITKMLLTGDVLSAIKTCINDKKISEALFLATFGDEECRKCVRTAFYEMQEHKPSYMRLSACIADNDLENAVQNADLSQWKDIFVFICTYATNEAFSPLCGVLGKRLENLDDFSSNRAAEFCYIASKSLQSYANLWLKELANCGTDDDSKSSYVGYVGQLTKLMDKVNAFRSIVAYEDDELSATKDWKLGGLYEVYLEYSRILLSAGHYEQARSYLNLVPGAFPGAKQEIERLSILLTPAPIPEVKRSTYGPAGSGQHPISSFVPQPIQSVTNLSNPYTSAYSTNVSHVAAPPSVSSPIPPSVVSNNAAAGWNDPPIVNQPPLRRAAPSLPAVRSPFPNAGATLPPNMSRTSSTSTLPPPPSVGSTAAAPPPPKVGEVHQPQVQTASQPLVNQSQRPANPYTPIGAQSPARTFSGLSSPADTQSSNAYVPLGGPTRTSAISPPIQPTVPFSTAVPPPKASANRVVPVPPTPSQRISSYEPVNVGFTQSPPTTMPPLSAQAPPSSMNSTFPLPPMASGSIVSPPPQNLSTKRQSVAGPSGGAAGMTTYPQGDRTHIPPNLRPIYEMLNAEFLRVSQSVPPQMSRVLYDMEKRLNVLYDRLNANAISKPLIDELYALAVALTNRDYQTASNIQVTMVTTLQDQCELWIVGITRLITISKSTA